MNDRVSDAYQVRLSTRGGAFLVQPTCQQIGLARILPPVSPFFVAAATRWIQALSPRAAYCHRQTRRTHA
eukprot:COSAG05_NODE_465_length_9537_cov_21.527086_5_plen_70_part_00